MANNTHPRTHTLTHCPLHPTHTHFAVSASPLPNCHTSLTTFRLPPLTCPLSLTQHTDKQPRTKTHKDTHARSHGHVFTACPLDIPTQNTHESSHLSPWRCALLTKPLTPAFSRTHARIHSLTVTVLTQDLMPLSNVGHSLIS